MREASWVPAWGQAMSDHRLEDDEPGFDDVTVCMTVPAGFGGDAVRVELSNRFGAAPVRIGRVGIGVGVEFVAMTFDGRSSTEIPAGSTRWTDPATLTIRHGDDLMVDLYLPEPTPYATAAGFRFDRSQRGDFLGARPFPIEGVAPEAVDPSREFPASGTTGSGWSLPAGGPFLRTIEVAGIEPQAVVVALGGSSTAMGWPQFTAAALPADARIAVVNRGISGNRIRLDAPARTPSWGRAGLTRFDDDVLGTHGVTHLVVAFNSNDWGLPGRITPLAEMPTLAQLVDAYRQLVERARAAGIEVILATVTPLAPELRTDAEREGLRSTLNHWIRTSGHRVVDFDAVLRSTTDPTAIAAEFAAPDDTHPNVDGERRLGRVVADALGDHSPALETPGS